MLIFLLSLYIILSNRYEAVWIDQHSSDFSLIIYIYPKDVTKCFKFSKKFLPADDPKIFHSVGNTHDAELIQEILIHKTFCDRTSLYVYKL